MKLQLLQLQNKFSKLNEAARDNINGTLWLAPSFLGVLIFYMVPMAVVVY